MVAEVVGQENIALTLGYVGTIPASFPINGVYQWSRGPEEALLRIALKRGSRVHTESMKETLRGELTRRFPAGALLVRTGGHHQRGDEFRLHDAHRDRAHGANLQENRDYLLKVPQELAALPYLRDIQFAQSLDYPTVEVQVDRERAGLSGASVAEVARSVVAATSSTRFVVPNYWPDPKTGIGYQVQLEIPQPRLTSVDDLGALPVSDGAGSPLLLRDVAQIQQGTMPGQYDRYNMKRELSLTANISGADLGRASREIQAILTRLEKAGDKPASVTVDVRGQIPPLRQILGGLTSGLILALIVIVLLLTANFQSWRLALVTVTAAPAVLAGVVLSLLATGTTLNIQSFIGTIMALGVAMANGILLVTFAEHERHLGLSSREAAVQGAGGRLRPILMTSAAMMAGMIPMALGLGETGPQMAPLGRAVIGGLVAATAATLLVLPAVFALIQAREGAIPRRWIPTIPRAPSTMAPSPRRMLKNESIRGPTCRLTLHARICSLLSLGLFAVAAGCQVQPAGQGGNPQPTRGRQPPLRVAVRPAERKTLVRKIDVPGQVAAFETAPLLAKVTGYVRRVHVDIGDRVHGPKPGEAGQPATGGDLLLELDVPELERELAQRKAAANKARAAVAQSEAAIQVAKAALVSAEAEAAEAKFGVEREAALVAKWKSEADRVTQLAASAAVTQKVADETNSQLQAAEAAVRQAEAKVRSAEARRDEAAAAIQQAEADLAAAQAEVQVAQAEVERAETMLGFATLRAPFDGVVTGRHVDPGHLVRVAANEPLLVISRIDPVRVVIEVPETDALLVRLGSPAALRVPSLPGASFAGQVTRTSESLDSGNRTLRVEIDIANPDGTLKPGPTFRPNSRWPSARTCCPCPGRRS